MTETDVYSLKDKQTLKSSLTKSATYLELITHIKSELSEKRENILSEISVSYQIILEKVEIERTRLTDWVSKEFDGKLLELTCIESELTELRQEVVELVEQDTQFNSHQAGTGTKEVSPSEDTFENQFLSLNSINSLNSYVSNQLLSKFEVPDYKLELDQLSLSAQLTGRLVPVQVLIFERDYSQVDLPLKYIGVSDRIKSSTSLINDVSTDTEGNIFALDRGNTQVHIFDSEFQYKYSFGERGVEIGEFMCPWSIAYCSHTNRIIISDCILSSVQSFDLNSKVVQRVKLGRVEKYAQIGGLCVDGDGVVFVVSSWENCVKVLSPKFKIIGHIGVDILNAPKDVKLSEDKLFVLEAIQPHFRIFSQTSQHLYDIHTNEFLYNPWFFCIDNLTDMFLVTEFSKHQVRVIDKEGRFIHTFGNDLLSFPAGIAVNNNKQILVCDSMHLRLVVF